MAVSLDNLLIIAGTLIGVLALALIAARLFRWRRDVAMRKHGTPVLVMPQDGPTAPQRTVTPRSFIPIRSSPVNVRRITPPSVQDITMDEVDAEVLLADPVPLTDRRTQPHSMPAIEDVMEEPEGSGSGPRIVEGSDVRFYRAEEGTLEFLPGRLEIVSGADTGQEIHFMRPVGEHDATVTFGRSEGPPLRHVQLLDPTVSRQHARLAWSAGRWHLANLSQTNPVTLNGAALPPTGRAVTLQEGDRIEMGAVVFLFREH